MKLSPRLLRRAERELGRFLGSYDSRRVNSGGSGACAKDLQHSRGSYVPDPPREREVVVATYHYDLKERTFNVTRSGNV